MKKLFNKLIGYYLTEEELNAITKHLKTLEFYEDSMNPHLKDGYDYKNLSRNEACLRRDIVEDGHTLRIFINQTDIYYEIESPWKSCKESCRFDPTDYPTIEALDELLKEISRRFAAVDIDNMMC